MTDTNDKPPISVRYSIGLLNPENYQALLELRDDLTQAGYPTEVDISPPPGQFSATASLEHILILVGGLGAAGAAVFSKKFLELAAEDAYKAVRAKLSKLKPRSAEADKLAIVITAEIDGVQVLNVLAKGPDDIRAFPTRPDRPHGHVLEINDSGGLDIKHSDGSVERHWTPPQ